MVREEMQCCKRLRNGVRGWEMAYEAGKCCKMYCSVCCRMLRDDVCRKSPAREAQQGLLEVSGVPVALSASHRASLRAFLGGFAQGPCAGHCACVALQCYGLLFLRLPAFSWTRAAFWLNPSWTLFPLAVLLWDVLPGRSFFERFPCGRFSFLDAFPSGLRPCATKGRSRFFAGAQRAR